MSVHYFAPAVFSACCILLFFCSMINFVQSLLLPVFSRFLPTSAIPVFEMVQSLWNWNIFSYVGMQREQGRGLLCILLFANEGRALHKSIATSQLGHLGFSVCFVHHPNQHSTSVFRLKLISAEVHEGLCKREMQRFFTSPFSLISAGLC